MAKGILLAAFDFTKAHEDEFHDWYANEHVPERLRVPGFLNAERWIDAENPKIHVATYDLDNTGVLSTPPYRAVTGDNQSVWTRRVTGMCRRIMDEIGRCTVVATGGLSDIVAPFSARIEHREPWLTLHGLRLVYERNVKEP